MSGRLPRWLRSRLSAILPGARTFLVAKRRWAAVRPTHLRPSRAWLAPRVPLLADAPAHEAAALNAAALRYFERSQSRPYWLNQPLSDRPAELGRLSRFTLLAAALRLLPGARVLDFGCGSGWTSVLLARMGLDVTGMDLAPAALDLARERAKGELAHVPDARLRFEAFAGDAIPAADGHFDAVFIFDAFHHLPNPRALLGEFHRVLAAHGRLAFGEPGIGHGQAAASEEERKQGVLEQDVDLERLYATAVAAGFRSLDVLVPPLAPEILTLPMPRLRAFLRGASWLVPADLLRREILTGPMGVFHKGPWRITSLAPGAVGARVRPSAFRSRARAGEPYLVEALVSNTAETVWLREGRDGCGYVRLGAHLLDASGRDLVFDYGRSDLPQDVAEGESVRLVLRLQAPERAGEYVVRLDLVNEGIHWFAARGSETADVILIVEAR